MEFNSKNIIFFMLIVMGFVFILEMIFKIIKIMFKGVCILLTVGVLLYGANFLTEVPNIAEQTIDKGIEITNEIENAGVFDNIKDNIKENIKSMNLRIFL